MRGIFLGESEGLKTRHQGRAKWLTAALAAVFIWGLPAESRVQASDDRLVILGGGGGGGADGGHGGQGGKLGTLLSGGSGNPGVLMDGGRGGEGRVYLNGAIFPSGGSSGGPNVFERGGQGGDAAYTAGESHAYDYLAIVGGYAGADGFSSPFGQGGMGGKVTYESSRDQTITGDGVYLRSGVDEGVSGGDASLRISNGGKLSIQTDSTRINSRFDNVLNTLPAGTTGAVLDLAKGGVPSGNIFFAVDNLEIKGSATTTAKAMATLNVSRGGVGGQFTAADSVWFGTLSLVDGGIFAAGSSSGDLMRWGKELSAAASTSTTGADFVFENLYIQGTGNELQLHHDNHLTFGSGTFQSNDKGRAVFAIPDIAGLAAADKVSPATTLLTMGQDNPAAAQTRAQFDLDDWSPDKLMPLLGNEKPAHLKAGQTLTLIDGVTATKPTEFDDGIVYGRGGGYGLTFTEMTVQKVNGVGSFIDNTNTQQADVLNLTYNYSAETTSGYTYNPYGQAQLATVSLITSISEENLKSLGLFRREEGAVIDASVSAGGGHTHTGCNIDLSYYTAALGASYGWQTPLGLSSVGAFFETGKSDYDTDIRIKSLDRWLKGSGDTKFWGGGLFLGNFFDNGFYVKGQLRAGTTENDYRVKGRHLAAYDSKEGYWGASILLGKTWAIDEYNEIDTYFDYQFVKLSGVQTRTKAGERIDFDDIESRRFHLGARYTRQCQDLPLAFYVGAAWQNELDAKAEGSVDGIEMRRNPFLKGQTALGELGLKYQSPDSGLMVDVSGWGGWGNQKLGGGSLTIGYAF